MKKTYKALVTDKATGNKRVITMNANTKKQVLEDIRANGYSVSNQMVKEADVFEWIMDQNYSSVEERNAYWKFTKIPQTEEEKEEMFEKYNRQAKRNYYIKRSRQRRAAR